MSSVGDMSLVGPRPILEDEHEKYGPVYELYVTVRPGITWLWQVSGRNNLEYEARLRYTRFYIQNWSCTLDLYILWRTVKTPSFRKVPTSRHQDSVFSLVQAQS